jgi:hypothetical protein
MYQGCELAAVVVDARGRTPTGVPGDVLVVRSAEVVLTGAFVRDHSVRLEYRAEAFAGIIRFVSHLRQLLQVAIDVPLVPRDEDGVDAPEVLVKGRASDTGLRGDL